MADLQSALEAPVSEFVADEQNYSSVPSVVQNGVKLPMDAVRM
jgi:hypothetical protein